MNLKTRINNESEHKPLLIEGLNFLEQNVPDINRKLLTLSTSFCMKIISGFGKERVSQQFALSDDFDDEQFVQHLALRLEFGVPTFIIQANLYERIINTKTLLPVVTALNFCIAKNMATIFNELEVRNPDTPCLYANSALVTLVNRTMGRFEELDCHELNKLAPLL